MYEIQPYFDKLNGLPSSKEILTNEEYDQYIQALMTYETAMAQLGVSNAPEIDTVPADLQEEFYRSSRILKLCKWKTNWILMGLSYGSIGFAIGSIWKLERLFGFQS